MEHTSAHRRASRARRMVGWILAALVLACYYSPGAAALRVLPARLTVAAGQQARIPTGFPLRVSLSHGDVQASSVGGERLSAAAPHASRATISLFGLLPVRELEIDVLDELVLFPGGQAVGVAMHTDGVLVVGTSDLSGAGGASPARTAGLKAGDLITQAGGVAVEDSAHLARLVEATGGDPLPLRVRRGARELDLTLQAKLDRQTGSYRMGAWVRDSTAGVGTLSFYGTLPRDGGQQRVFGALGHAVTDADTHAILPVGRGQMMLADIVDVRKGARGVPGELRGSFLRESRVLGDIQSNTIFGVYGNLTAQLPHPLYPDGLPIGRKDAVHEGPASILCTVDGEGMREYAVELIQVFRQNKPEQRSMIVEVTDERLLAKTGGIVQGMSGSPILQDGRLIGAVTHVYVNDPTRGYGLYIEWMLDQ